MVMIACNPNPAALADARQFDFMWGVLLAP